MAVIRLQLLVICSGFQFAALFLSDLFVFYTLFKMLIFFSEDYKLPLFASDIYKVVVEIKDIVGRVGKKMPAI